MKTFFLLSRFSLFLLMFFSLPALGQHPILTKVTPPIEINWGAIIRVSQDQQGFLWLASVDGLHRYDGTRFVSFYHNENDDNSLALDRLETVFISKSGIIWIGTYGKGLDRYDPLTETFTHFTHQPADSTSLSNNIVTVIIEDRQGVLWVGTHGGLHRFHPESGTFTRYRHDPQNPNSLSHDQVRVVYEDRRGALWIGTGSPWESKPGEGGLNRFNRDIGTFTRYLHNPQDPNTLLDNKVMAIFEDSGGTLWIGTLGDGLHTMNREKGTFTRHQYDPRQPDKLSTPPNVARRRTVGVSFVHEDVTGAIWIGNYGNGLSRYDQKTGKTQHFGQNTENPNGLMQNSIWSAYNSLEGVLWLSTLGGDLYRADPLRESFKHQRTGAKVYSLFEDGSGTVWAGTSKGMKLYDRQKGGSRQNQIEATLPPTLKKESVYAIIEDQSGLFWIGSESGLWRQDPQSKSLIRFEDGLKGLGEIEIHALHEGREKVIWVGTNKGLVRIGSDTNEITTFQNNPDNPNSLGSNFILSVHEDSSGNLWIGTDAGVSRLDIKTGNFQRYLGNRHEIVSIQEDGSGRILFGSIVNGLFTYDELKDEIVRFRDIESGKEIRANVLSMVLDDQGNVWTATKSGLEKIDKEGSIAAAYGIEMGLISGAFSEFAAHKGPGGDLYFGDSTGFYSFHPDKIKVNKKPPQVSLTDVKLFDKSIIPGKKAPLAVSLEEAEEIRFSHNQNVFTFDFAGIHFTQPDRNQHFFMLENYDTDWHSATGEYSAPYYKVPPGKYVFRVKAASSGGVWAEKAIEVVVLPPWYKTLWAYAFYGLIMAGGIFAVDRNQRRRIILRERERNRERELAHAKEIEKAYTELKSTQAQLIQSEKMASLGELTAGIAHEIQNPLNFVNNFSEVSNELIEEIKEARGKSQETRQRTEEDELEDEILEDIKQNLSKIAHHGKRADAIVKSMLEHSKTGTGSKELTDLNKLVADFIQLAYQNHQAKDKAFEAEFTLDLDPNLPKVEVIPADLGKVILNLVNNAFYAVNEKRESTPRPPEGGVAVAYKPTVILTTSFNTPLQGGRRVEISVKDNGPGIPDSIKEKIFQPFFTTKPTGQGTGLGLSLAYDIVKAHGGELKVETKEGEGTLFIIQLSTT